MQTRLLLPVRWLWKSFKKQSKKKKIVIVVGIVILGLVVNGIVNKPDPATRYQFETASRGSITQVVSESGNITASGITPLYSTTTGIVEAVYVQNGQVVAANAPLFKVKATATKQQKDALLASYLQAKAGLEAAKAQQLTLQAQMFSAWDSYKELAESDNYEDADGRPRNSERNVADFQVPEKQWLAAESAYKNQAQVIAQANAAVSAAWLQYQSTQDSQVTAIFAGQVENLAVGVGDRIDIQSAQGSFPALVLVQPGVSTTIRIAVSETDIAKVTPGLSAKVEIDAFEDVVYEAVVDRVDSVALPVSGVVEYSVYLSLLEPDNRILAGMTADVDIVVESRDGILTVPSSAVKPYEGKRAVRVMGADGQVEYLPVEIGISGQGLVEIVSGIQEGTQVITALTNDQARPGGPGGLF